MKDKRDRQNSELERYVKYVGGTLIWMLYPLAIWRLVLIVRAWLGR